MTDSTELWKIAISVGGLAAVGAYVFLALYRGWLKLSIFGQLTPKHTYQLMLLFLVLTFSFAVISVSTYFFYNPAREGEKLGWDYYYNALASRDTSLQSEAFRYFMQGAASGDAEAMTVLGNIYCRVGLGFHWMNFHVPKDINLSFMWFGRAIEKKNPVAMANKAECLIQIAREKDTPVFQRESLMKEARELQDKAEKAGYIPG